MWSCSVEIQADPLAPASNGVFHKSKYDFIENLKLTCTICIKFIEIRFVFPNFKTILNAKLRLFTVGNIECIHNIQFDECVKCEKKQPSAELSKWEREAEKKKTSHKIMFNMLCIEKFENEMK